MQRWSPFPATDIMLCCFAASLASKVRPTSVRVYLSAVRNMHVELSYEDPLTEAMLLNRVVKGIGRHHGTAVEKPRLPITFPILRELINTFRQFPSLNHHDKLCLQAAMLAIFFGFFRCGELLSTGALRSDVSFASGMLHVHLSRFKTDPLSKGIVVIAPAVPPYYPVRAMINYLASARQGSSAPLFVLANGTHLTRSVFTAHVRTMLSASGVHNWYSYAEHSFRIGAATTAAIAGLPDQVIRAAGRWRSDACLRYIRPPASAAYRLSEALASVAAEQL